MDEELNGTPKPSKGENRLRGEWISTTLSIRPQAHFRLRNIAGQHRISLKALWFEAMDAWLRQHNEPPFAEDDKK